MNRLLIALAACAAGLMPMQASAQGSPGPVSYPGGAVATATPKCAPGELCATIVLGNGDSIKVLTGGSGKCNPYVMTFMRYHAGQLDAVWSTPTDRSPDAQGAFGSHCGNFQNTHMLLENGTIDMAIFQNKDGTVFVQFFPGPK